MYFVHTFALCIYIHFQQFIRYAHFTFAKLNIKKFDATYTFRRNTSCFNTNSCFEILTYLLYMHCM